MKYIENINSLQMEISSNCNLRCTGCVRTNEADFESVSSLINKNIYLDIDVIKNLLDSKYLQNLHYIDFCGSIDDPLMHPKFLDIIDYITNKGIKIIVQTNASLRSEEYWKNMASILKKNPSSYVKFSFDGLEETNHLYRRGSNWNKIMSNANAYIAAGGKAQWQFIVFPWNKHQVEDARVLSEEMGFDSFRYRHDRGSVPSTEEEKQERIAQYNERISLTWNEVIKYYDARVQTEEIDCYAKQEQQFFITHEGLVWPCCFLHNAQYRKYEQWKEYTDRFDKNYDKGWNSLYSKTFDSIFEHEFYKNNLSKSWDSKTHGTGKCDRLLRCTQTCSKASTNIGNHLVIHNKEKQK